METTRQQKISRLLQKEIGTILQRESQTICPGRLVSVTNVRVTSDLSLARVNLSVFPTEKGVETLALVKAHYKIIRNALGHEVRNQLRIVPVLEFYIDESLDLINRIEELIKK